MNSKDNREVIKNVKDPKIKKREKRDLLAYGILYLTMSIHGFISANDAVRNLIFCTVPGFFTVHWEWVCRLICTLTTINTTNNHCLCIT